MAKYESQYPELGFYVKGELKQFNGGKYATVDKSEIEVLDNLSDAVKVDEPVVEVPKPKAPAKPKK